MPCLRRRLLAHCQSLPHHCDPAGPALSWDRSRGAPCWVTAWECCLWAAANSPPWLWATPQLGSLSPAASGIVPHEDSPGRREAKRSSHSQAESARGGEGTATGQGQGSQAARGEARGAAPWLCPSPALPVPAALSHLLSPWALPPQDFAASSLSPLTDRPGRCPPGWGSGGTRSGQRQPWHLLSRGHNED